MKYVKKAPLKNKKDLYQEFAGDFKNEAELEEELEEEGVEVFKVEKEHFEEEAD